MPLDKSLTKVLVIGSGPIIIGQAAEFDYAGTQACKSLKEEGIKVVLVNSNPATIMTDENVADRVYIQPLTVEALEYIISQERPDALLPTLGGQIGLNMAVELAEAGILEKYQVRLLGSSLEAIKTAEDREHFRRLMLDIGQPIPRSEIVESMEQGLAAAERIGYPIIVRPAYTMGGLGGGIAVDQGQLKELLHTGLWHSRIGQVLLEQSVAGWKEIEYEVMRDSNDTCIVICNMENIDPVGIHTGDSIVVAPSQTLTDNEYHMLRTASIEIIRALRFEGGCNVQYALNPKSKQYIVIEVNPRVSRSSALASKAAGYPIAKVAAKIAVGLHLHEIPNVVTRSTKASFEPTLDYVVTKIPKWPFDKFEYADRRLGTQMKATGEVMAIDRTFEASFLKAIISLESSKDTGAGLWKKHMTQWSLDKICTELQQVTDERIFVVAQALRRDMEMDQIHQLTGIDLFFLAKIKNIIRTEEKLKTREFTAELLAKAEKMGFTDKEITKLSGVEMDVIDAMRRASGIYPVYKMVDTCAGEFESYTPYYYSTYEQEDENRITGKEKIIVIGSGPIRIGQGIEFDYSCVHAVWAIRELGYEAIIINNNPETVSTDFDISDKLYFEPLYIEDVLNVIRKEMPRGVIVQFGGQTAINLAHKLMRSGVQILGTGVDSIDVAENRKRFDILLRELKIPRPEGTSVTHLKEAIKAANQIGYPVLVRPSYVIGGRAMMIVSSDQELTNYIRQTTDLSFEYSILIDKYISGIEVEVDAICDRQNIFIPGIMEHIERTGVHSGDSICVYPPRNLSSAVKQKIIEYTHKISVALGVCGLVNIQFAVAQEEVYIIEVNPRASRTVPILSKVTDTPMVQMAMEVILGRKLEQIGLKPELPLVAVKAPVFSFVKLGDVDAALTPEMKSTGEVLGLDRTYEKALLKAFIGAGYSFVKTGKVLVILSDETKSEGRLVVEKLVKLGYDIVATLGTHHYLRQYGIDSQPVDIEKLNQIEPLLKQGEIEFLVNTPTLGKDTTRYGFKIRSLAQHLDIMSFTSLDTIHAYLIARNQYFSGESLTYRPLSDYRLPKEEMQDA